MASTVKKISNYLPPLRDQGMDYLAAANAAGVSIQHGSAILDGNAQTITLVSEMANATFTVLMTNETASARVPAITAKTTTTFVLDNAGTNLDVLGYAVIGQISGQTAP